MDADHGAAIVGRGRYRWLGILARATMVVVVFAITCYCLAASGLSYRQPQTQEVLPLSADGEFVVVPITLNSKNYQFALACDATNHVFDSDLRSFLPRPLKEVAVNRGRPSETRAMVHRAPPFALGNTVIDSDDYVLSSSMEFARELSGTDIRGMVGAPFFRSHVVQIDFDERVLRIFLPGDPPEHCGSQFPLSPKEDGTFLIEGVLVGGLEESFSIDTASSRGVEVHHWLFRKLETSGCVRMASVSHAHGDLSGTHVVRHGLLSSLAIGSICLQDIPVDESSSNVLGLKYLSQFLVTIDVPGRHLYLKPGKKFNKPWPRYECGLGVLRHDRRTLVGPVYDGGVAMSNGIITGDEIIAVNGHGVSNMPLSEVRQRLRTFEATQVTLELSREGVHRQVVLTTEDVFKQPAEKAPSENGHQGRQ